jgi:hypothetical protein
MPMARASIRTGFRLAAALAAACLLWQDGAFAARRQKTVFRSQPTEWDPSLESDGRAAPIVFRPAWTFAGFSSPLAGDPAAAGETLVAASQDGRLVAIRTGDGTAAWAADLGEPLSVGPAVFGARVVQAARSGRLAAFAAADGAPSWTTDLGGEPAWAPRAVGGRLLAGTAGGDLIALDPATGAELARRALPGRAVAPPEPAPGALVVGTEQGFILALEESTLEVRWRHAARHPITSPALYHDGRVYVAAADRGVRCLRFRDGRRRWIARTGAMIVARPFARGRYVYVACYDNDIYVLRARNGHLMTRVRLARRLNGNAAVTDFHYLVVPFTEGSVIGLALPGLQAAGRFELDKPGEWFTTGPVPVNGLVALGWGRNAGRIVALEITAPPEEGGTGEAATPPEGGADQDG